MRKIQEVPIAKQPNSPFCAVSALKDLIDIPGYPCGPTDSVFNIPDMKGGWIPLTRNMATPVLGRQVELMGLDPKKYVWHAFRRGGLQYGSQVVPNLEMLRLHGGWESEAMNVYLDLPATSRFQVTEMILTSLTK